MEEKHAPCTAETICRGFHRGLISSWGKAINVPEKAWNTWNPSLTMKSQLTELWNQQRAIGATVSEQSLGLRSSGQRTLILSTGIAIPITAAVFCFFSTTIMSGWLASMSDWNLKSHRTLSLFFSTTFGCASHQELENWPILCFSDVGFQPRPRTEVLSHFLKNVVAM